MASALHPDRMDGSPLGVEQVFYAGLHRDTRALAGALYSSAVCHSSQPQLCVPQHCVPCSHIVPCWCAVWRCELSPGSGAPDACVQAGFKDEFDLAKWDVLNFVVDATFLVDIYVNLRTCFMLDGMLITDPMQIAGRYVHSRRPKGMEGMAQAQVGWVGWGWMRGGGLGWVGLGWDGMGWEEIGWYGVV